MKEGVYSHFKVSNFTFPAFTYVFYIPTYTIKTPGKILKTNVLVQFFLRLRAKNVDGVHGVCPQPKISQKNCRARRGM